MMTWINYVVYRGNVYISVHLGQIRGYFAPIRFPLSRRIKTLLDLLTKVRAASFLVSTRKFSKMLMHKTVAASLKSGCLTSVLVGCEQLARSLPKKTWNSPCGEFSCKTEGESSAVVYGEISSEHERTDIKIISDS